MLRLMTVLAAVLLVFTSQTIPTAVQAQNLQATPVAPANPTPHDNDDDTPLNGDEGGDIAPEKVEEVPDRLQPAGEYCLMQGGILVERFPFAGTASGSPRQLDGSRWFCEFTGSEEADPPTSRISIGLSTIYASNPTLAAIAYLGRPQVPGMNDGENLAVQYCAWLGGTSAFGTRADGGWASDVEDPAATAISICAFPDGSAIDDWGLYYHSQGTIRGADLEPLLRYQGDVEPESIFGVD